MKPPPFEYVVPGTLDEALDALDEHGDTAKVLAGGQSLVPLMNLRLAFPEVLVDLNRIAELDYVTETDDGVAIGAMARQRTVERSALVRDKAPLVAQALGHVGHFQIRSRGTVGGSIAHADAAAELPAALLALGGHVTVRSRARGPRAIPADELFADHFTTTLEPDEILTEVVFPAHPARAGWCFQEFARRHGDYALAGVAVLLVADAGRVQTASISLLGVSTTAVRAVAAEQAVTGGDPDADIAAAAEEAVRGEPAPTGNLHGSGEYRRHLAAVLTRRAVSEAQEMALR